LDAFLKFGNSTKSLFCSTYSLPNTKRDSYIIYNGEGKPHTDFSVSAGKQGRKEEIFSGNMDTKAIVHQRRDMSIQKLLV